MTEIDWLPTAKRDPKGRVLSWAERSDPKGCLHTTETSGWPGYQSWTVHPHVTILPLPGKGIEVRQNVPFSRASFSLRNLPGGVETNRDYVFQFELIGTCTKNGPGYYWPGADDTVLTALYREVIHPLSTAYGIPLQAPTFQAYPASFGPSSGTNNVRMSGRTFDNYSGWLGHQHVPENSHGDPGAFPWARMIELGEEDPPMTSAERKALVEDIIEKLVPSVEAAVLRVLRDREFIANQHTNPDDVSPVTFWTLAGVLSNLEKDVDLIRQAVDKLTTETEPTQGKA